MIKYSAFYPAVDAPGIEGSALPATRNVNLGEWIDIPNGTTLNIGDTVKYYDTIFTVKYAHIKTGATAGPDLNPNYDVYLTSGANGQTLYTWIAYADNVTGTNNFTTGLPVDRTYIGIASNKTSSTESTNPADYTWSKTRGIPGPTMTITPNKAGFIYVNGVLSPLNPEQVITYTVTATEGYTGPYTWTTNPNIKSATSNTFSISATEMGSNTQVIVSATTAVQADKPQLYQSVLLQKIADPLADPTISNVSLGFLGQGDLSRLNAVTSTYLRLGEPTNIIPDGNFQDVNFWHLTPTIGGFYDLDSSWEMARALIFYRSNNFDIASEFFDLEVGATYKVKTRIWNNDVGGGWNGAFWPMIHMPSVAWWSLKHGVPIQPDIADASNAIIANGDTGNLTHYFTCINNNMRRIQFRFKSSGALTGVIVQVQIVKVSTFATDVVGIGRPENYADVSRDIVPSVPRIILGASSTGVIKASELPRTISLKLIANGIPYTSGITWRYQVISGTFNSLTNSSGMQPLGGDGITNFTVVSSGPAGARVRIFADYASVTRTFDLPIEVVNDPPPSVTPTPAGGSGTTSSISTFTATNALGNTYGSSDNLMPNITTGSTGLITFEGILTYDIYGNSNGTARAYSSFQYRLVGSGTWIDISGAENVGTDAQRGTSIDEGFVNDAGYLDTYTLSTGLSANTSYEIRIRLRDNSTSKSLRFTDGTVMATGS